MNTPKSPRIKRDYCMLRKRGWLRIGTIGNPENILYCEYTRLDEAAKHWAVDSIILAEAEEFFSMANDGCVLEVYVNVSEIDSSHYISNENMRDLLYVTGVRSLPHVSKHKISKHFDETDDEFMERVKRSLS